MDETEQPPDAQPKPRRRRRAVGPAGARPSADEPRPDPRPERSDDRAERERYEAERPPHHEPR